MIIFQNQFVDVVVIPAYGRDYVSCAGAIADWTANKDFQIAMGLWTGAYVNLQDARQYNIKRLGILYADGAGQVIVNVEGSN